VKDLYENKDLGYFVCVKVDFLSLFFAGDFSVLDLPLTPALARPNFDFVDFHISRSVLSKDNFVLLVIYILSTVDVSSDVFVTKKTGTAFFSSRPDESPCDPPYFFYF